MTEAAVTTDQPTLTLTASATDTEEMQAELDRLKAHDAEIRELERDCDHLEKEWEAAKKAANVAKANYERSVASLRDRARHGPTLFDQKGSESDEPDWESVSIDELDISPGIRDALLQSAIVTIGDLTRRMAAYPLTDIEGVGEQMASMIEDALSKFWASRPLNPAPPDEPESEDE